MAEHVDSTRGLADGDEPTKHVEWQASTARSIGAVLLGAAAALAGAGTSSAEPDQASGAASRCFFTLSPPQMTELSGGAKVAAATYAPSSCMGSAIPIFSTVCLDGPSGVSRCVENYGWVVAQVYLELPSVSGEFTSTGRGCWRVSSSEFTCAPAAPIRKTL
jgi:hypothetical protein